MSEVERPRSGLSQASSVVTVASLSLGSKALKKIHSFGKREHSIRRDPNSPVLIRGWLYKQDSSGLKMWKRRWFVLSNFCLFYYRDSREETVLGSIPLPSYIISAANPKEVKSRKYAFKAAHPGMRTYYFSADTQEDMSGWVRAMNQSALVETDRHSKAPSLTDISGTAKDKCYTSYEDFTIHGLAQNRECTPSPESLELAELAWSRETPNFPQKVQRVEEGGKEKQQQRTVNGHRGLLSLSASFEQFGPQHQNGIAPPPTPVSGVREREFVFRGGEGSANKEEGPLQRKDSLSHVEEWVRSQKGKMTVQEFERESVGHYYSRNGQVFGPYVHQGDDYKTLPTLSSTQVSPTRGLQPQEEQPHRQAYSLQRDETEKKEKQSSITEGEWPQHITKQDAPSLSIGYRSRPLASVFTDKAEFTNPRPMKAMRSNSLPPTPSEVPRAHVLRRTNTSDERIRAPPQACSDSESRSGQRPLSRPSTPAERVNVAPPRFTGQVTKAGHRAPAPLGRYESGSCEELSLISSKSLMRPHTPVGRVDIHPSLKASEHNYHIPKHLDEKPTEHYTSTPRTRSQLVRPSSRPQTPSERYDILPSEDSYGSPRSTIHGSSRLPTRSHAPGPLEERHVEGSSAPGKGYGTSGRLHGRSNTPVDKVAVPQISDRFMETSSTPTLGRHRGQVPRQILQYPDYDCSLPPSYPSRGSSTPRLQGKMISHHASVTSCSQLPPLPPLSSRASIQLHSGKRPPLTITIPGSEIYRERIPQPIRMAESDVDVLLTKLCGQDKLLQSLVLEVTQLRAEKEKLENALEMTRLHMEEFSDQFEVAEKIAYQQRGLQDELIQIRAKLCDVSMEMERGWNDYMALETELYLLRSSLERVCKANHPQEEAEAQRDLWMMEEILSGLQGNKDAFLMALDSTRHPVLSLPSPGLMEQRSIFSRSPVHLPTLHSLSSRPVLPREAAVMAEDTPPRPPLPQEHPNFSTKANPNITVKTSTLAQPEWVNGPESKDLNALNKALRSFYSEQNLPSVPGLLDPLATAPPPELLPRTFSDNNRDQPSVTSQGMPSSRVSQSSRLASYITSHWKNTDSSLKDGTGLDTISRKVRMSAEEQEERMRRHQAAHLHERTKPNILGQRQGTGSRKPQPTNHWRTKEEKPSSDLKDNSQDRLMAASLDTRSGSTTKVTKSYLPTPIALSTGTPAGEKQGMGEQSTKPQPQARVTEVLTMNERATGASKPAQSRVLEVSLVKSPASLPMRSVSVVQSKMVSSPPVTVALKASNKASAAMLTPKKEEGVETQEGTSEKKKAQNTANKLFITARYVDPDSDVSPTPEELEARQKTVEKIKSMVSRTSPGAVVGGCSGFSTDPFYPERERDRIINLSYILAAEASQRSKLMAAKALAELQEDISHETAGQSEPASRDLAAQGVMTNKEAEQREEKINHCMTMKQTKEPANLLSETLQDTPMKTSDQEQPTNQDSEWPRKTDSHHQHHWDQEAVLESAMEHQSANEPTAAQDEAVNRNLQADMETTHQAPTQQTHIVIQIPRCNGDVIKPDLGLRPDVAYPNSTHKVATNPKKDLANQRLIQEEEPYRITVLQTSL
nr:PREDICTED: pleckstrin homology domain-containing family A member 7-like isoform X1 [Latimeria chalumnae]|eukprot:XP_014354108.1 PREDICTED: pleckstrin homology domain-containing family A member 7-like isoform X1 [Latimeria chalumnae]